MISRCLLLAVLIAWAAAAHAAETGTLTAATEAEAQAAAVDENPCAGMADGEFMGVEACNECHEDKVAGIRMNPHGHAADSRTPFALEECETCHGPGTTHFDVEGNCIISLRGRFGESVEQRNGICLNCHGTSGHMMHWPGSTHENEDLACTSCHTIHAADGVLERTTQAEVCYQCHQDIRAQTYRMSTHPIRAGKVVCSDCHNPHGSHGPSSLQKLSVNDTCYLCHAEKRGPFLWEHYPVTEDCTLCHTPHGSNHAPLLNRQRPQLCQQCHEDIRTQGRRHVRRFLDFNDTDPNRGRFIVGESCQNCHSQVHGSNHPSGANLLR